MCEELKDVYERLWKDAPPLPFQMVLNGNWDYFSVSIMNDGKNVAGWRVTRHPGLVVISGAGVYGSYQGKGIGRALAKFRVDAFRAIRWGGGYPCEEIDQICRVAPRNSTQIHLMETEGWERISPTLWRVR